MVIIILNDFFNTLNFALFRVIEDLFEVPILIFFFWQTINTWRCKKCKNRGLEKSSRRGFIFFLILLLQNCLNVKNNYKLNAEV